MKKHIFKPCSSSNDCSLCIKCNDIFYNSFDFLKKDYNYPYLATEGYKRTNIALYGREYIGIPYIENDIVFIINEITREPTGVISECKYSDDEFYVKQILT